MTGPSSGLVDGPQLRRATPEDLTPLADLWTRSAAEAFLPLLPEGFALPSRQAIEARLRHGLTLDDVAITVAEDRSALLGYVGAGPSRDPDVLDPTGEIWSIFLDPGARGRGVGSLLMERALDQLAHFREVTVWSFRGNERANAFYERHGFVRDGAEKRMAEWAQVPIVRYRRARPNSPS